MTNKQTKKTFNKTNTTIQSSYKSSFFYALEEITHICLQKAVKILFQVRLITASVKDLPCNKSRLQFDPYLNRDLRDHQNRSLKYSANLLSSLAAKFLTVFASN